MIKAEYINHMGDDLMVVNAARVSFEKESDWDYFDVGDNHTRELLKKDHKLISYLSQHEHWTPFAHPQICLRISAPIFLARQLFKHKVGFVENEVSRRYVDSEPEFYIPDVWRQRAKNKKQGSSNESVVLDEILEARLYQHHHEALKLYEDLLKAGVCPEQARVHLPQDMMTQWYWTGSLAAWARVYKLRTDESAQREHQLLTPQIDAIIRPLFPHSWDALVKTEE